MINVCIYMNFWFGLPVQTQGFVLTVMMMMTLLKMLVLKCSGAEMSWCCNVLVLKCTGAELCCKFLLINRCRSWYPFSFYLPVEEVTSGIYILVLPLQWYEASYDFNL